MASSLSQVRSIDNTRHRAPFVTLLLIGILFTLAIWFIRGGSFRLYASLFFGLYFLTNTSWLSIILVSVLQNIFLLPLRVLYERLHPDLKKFEDQITETKEDDQYFLLNRKVREGDMSVLFYILNFVILVIAFVSAGRVFFLEFYHTPIDSSYLYSFIPYPHYPLHGVIFSFPFIRVLSSFAISWKTIITLWLIPILFLTFIKLIWRFIKPLLWKNQDLLKFRIGYNRLLVILGGFTGTLFILSVYFLRHVPNSFEFYYLTADLSRQNTVFNIITAVCTFLATIYSGIRHNQEASATARQKNLSEELIARVSRAYMRNSFRNGIFLAVMALWATRLMPSSHDLSVLAFEACYVLSPLTFDRLIPKRRAPTPPISQTETPTQT